MEIKGIIPACVTLFKGDQEIDENAMREHLEYLIKSGVHGIFVLGSIGEFAYLSETEKKQVIEIAADQIRGKIPLLVGISSPGTKTAIELAKYAEKKGANGVMAVPQTYFPVESRNIEMHYEKIAASIEIPLYAYNFPLTTKVDLSPKLIAKLAEKNILKGIKETVTDISHIEQMLEATPEDFTVLCGTELMFNKALKLKIKGGIKGAILGMGNCFPELLIQIWDAFKAGQEEKFEALWTDFSKILPLQSQPLDYLPSLTKEILYAMGRQIDTQVRSPLRVLEDRMRKKVQQILK